MKNVLKKYNSVLGSRCYPMPTLPPPPLSSSPLSSSPLTSLRFFSSKSSPSPSIQQDDDEDNEKEKIELPTKYRSLKKSRGMNVTNVLTSCEPASWLATSSSKRKPSFHHVSTSNISPPSPASSFSHPSVLSSLTQPNTATRASAAADSVRIKEGTLPSHFEVHQKEGEKEGEEHHYQQKVRSTRSIRRRMAESSSPCFGFHPEEWCKSYPIAINGTRQSPIDITSSGCKCVDTGTGLLDLKYPDSIPGLTVKNTGHGWIVNIPPDVARNTCLSGGPLGEDKYVLEQFHCHWGSNCSCGSEHTVDGKSYAAELHLVHWNTSRFSSFSEAASQDKGLAVLGVFLDATGSEPNPDLSKVTDRMTDIKYKNSSAPLDGALVIQNLLPADKSFWTYEGSLTTPPLFESVTWLVLKNPIQVTEQEVAQFRQICFHEECERPPEGDVQVTANFRPTQPIHDRVVSYIG